MSITRFSPVLGWRTSEFSCGKCAQCLSLKRSSLVTDALLAAETASSVCLATFTYADEHMPVATSCLTDGNLHELAYSRGISKYGPFYPNGPKGRYKNCYHKYGEDGREFAICCTPFREDLKNTFKRFRMAYKRKYGKDSAFRYCAYPELGELRGRPHFHAIIFDLEFEAVPLLKAAWHYGNMDYETPETKYGRSPELVDFIRTSKYISKYISKGPFGRFSYLRNFVQPFRKQRSLRFGVSEEKLNMLRDWYCSPFVPASVLSERSKRFLVFGEECVMSPSLYKKLYYEKRAVKLSLHKRRELRARGVQLTSSDIYFPLRKNATAIKMLAFQRKQSMESNLRTAAFINSQKDPDVFRREFCREVSRCEESKRQNTAFLSKQIIYQQLNTSKDGQ